MKSDPRVEAYIEKAGAFARPVLTESRARIRRACPGIEETIKWNVPFFLHEGRIVASMAAFKQHVKVGVWVGMKPVFVDVASVAELPAAKIFVQQVKDAVAQVAAGAVKKGAAGAVKKGVAKKGVAKKAVAKKAVAKTTPATKAVAKKAPATKAVAKKAAPTKKTATKKSARPRS